MLLHAQLYVLGDRYRIKGLCNQSLHVLYCLLKRSPPTTKARCLDMCVVVGYCYKETYGGNKLRNLLSLYMAFHVRTFNQVPEFRKLLASLGGFSQDLVGEISELAKGSVWG